MMNYIMSLQVYKKDGSDRILCFDDIDAGLLAEPFVCGADEILRRCVAEQKKEYPFVLTFSADPFPCHQYVAEKVREENGGTWYRTELGEGWLCPALFKYIPRAPDRLYFSVE